MTRSILTIKFNHDSASATHDYSDRGRAMNRNRESRMLMMLFIVLLSSACRTARPGAVLRGRVVDPSAKPVAGVQVRLARATVTSNANGEFAIGCVPASERLCVSFSARNYIETTRIYNTRRNLSTGNTVVIWPRASAQSLSATRGGTLTFAAGTVTIPPRALADDRGRTVDGDVRLSFSAFDVMDARQYRGAPGDFTARMRDNTIRQLKTFAVFEIYVEDSNGRRLDLTPGKLAEVELSVPEVLEPPESVGSYRFEEATGLWVEVGRFRRTGRRRLSAAISTVQSTWNADDPQITTCLVIAADCACAGGLPTGFSVDGLGVDYAQSFTAGDNQCVNVQTNSKLSLTPTHGSLNGAAVEITTPSALANCTTPSGCRTVTFHCPDPNAITSALASCNDPGWYCADGYANKDPHFDVFWKQEQMTIGGGTMTLGLQQCTPPLTCSSETYQAAQLQSTCYYGYGLYETRLKAAYGSGVVTGFFVYTGPEDGPRQDEIDIEFFGQPGNNGCAAGQTAVQLNYFVNGQENPVKKCLGFDATQVMRRYAFDWRATGITWYVDTNNNGTYEASEELHSVSTADGPLPVLPGKLMANMWAGANDAATVTWMGAFSWTAQSPPVATFDLIRYTP